MTNPYQIVAEFEQSMANYTGAPYAIAVESCSAALFLCCLYEKVSNLPEVIIPKFTYPSVPSAIIHAGGRVKFGNIKWQERGWYLLLNTKIIDSATYLANGMYLKIKSLYQGSRLICLSFHSKKCLPIGRGGMILTDNSKAYNWFKAMRFDGRHECPLSDDKLAMVGWDMYMTPEQVARGLELMQWLKDGCICEPSEYQDLSQYKFFTDANRDKK